jgi:ATP-dependent exoDNAse (exonuclease V) alpha subunit
VEEAGFELFVPHGAAGAVQLISENPYRLARDIRGIGFRTADQIAGRLGIEKTALIRVRAGIAYALTDAMDEGHCGLPAEELIPLTQNPRGMRTYSGRVCLASNLLTF